MAVIVTPTAPTLTFSPGVPTIGASRVEPAAPTLTFSVGTTVVIGTVAPTTATLTFSVGIPVVTHEMRAPWVVEYGGDLLSATPPNIIGVLIYHEEAPAVAYVPPPIFTVTGRRI